MAGEDLYTALQNLNVPATSTGYGIGATALAQSLPQLVNPTGSVGRNLGVVLGGALMSSLLGYQARKQATEDSILATTLGSQMLRMKTPEERLALVQGVDNTIIQPRLLSLQSALQGREEANRLGAAEAGMRQEALYGALGSEAGQNYLAAQTGAYAAKAAATAEERRRTLQLKNELDTELKTFSTDEKLRLESERDKQEMDLIDAGEDPTIARQKAIARTRAQIQDKLNEKQFERQTAIEEFKANLKQADLGATESKEVTAIASISNQIFDLANEVEQMSPAEFKAKKNFDAIGGSIKSKSSILQSDVTLARAGLSQTKTEVESLLRILGNDFTTGPESYARNLRTLAATMIGKGKQIAANSSKTPQEIYNDLDYMLTTQKPLEPKIKRQGPMGAPTVAPIDFGDLEARLAPSSPAAVPSAPPAATPTAVSTADSAEAVAMEERALQQEANRLQEQGLAIPYELGQKAVQLKQRKAALGL